MTRFVLNYENQELNSSPKMIYIQPILFVSGDDEHKTLGNAYQDVFIKNDDFDILVPYEYQKIHYKLLNRYIAPDYYRMCPVGETLTETLQLFNENPYKSIFKYFFVKFRLSNKNGGIKEFQEWLNGPHLLFFRRMNLKIIRSYQMRRYYNTIVIDLNLTNGNKWNRFWGLAPNFYNKDTIFHILDYLTDGGKLIFINIEGNMDKIFDYTRKGFIEIDKDYFIKKASPKKKKYKIPRIGL